MESLKNRGLAEKDTFCSDQYSKGNHVLRGWANKGKTSNEMTRKM